MGNFEDNKEVPYNEGRYLDAWARVLDIQAPSSAVKQVEETLYISFNKVEKDANNAVLNIIDYALNGNVNTLLFVALAFNKTVIAKSTKPFKTFFSTSAGMLLEASKDKEVSPGVKIKEVVKKQLDVLIDLLEGYPINEDPSFFSAMARINQDIVKLQNHNYGAVTKVVLLNNPEKLHAELVIAEIFKQNTSYIGNSKLCCYLCDEILKDYGFAHRGTHGTLYLNGFNMPKSLEENTLNRLLQNIKDYFYPQMSMVLDNVYKNTLVDEIKGAQDAELSESESEEKEIEPSFNIQDNLKELKEKLDFDHEVSEIFSREIYNMREIDELILTGLQSQE